MVKQSSFLSFSSPVVLLNVTKTIKHANTTNCDVLKHVAVKWVGKIITYLHTLHIFYSFLSGYASPLSIDYSMVVAREIISPSFSNYSSHRPNSSVAPYSNASDFVKIHTLKHYRS